MASTVWRGYVSFGLISIPVRLYRAARAERISFRRVYRQSSGNGAAASSDVPEADEDESPHAAESSRAKFNSNSGGPSPELFTNIPSAPLSGPQAVQAEPVLTPVQQALAKKGTEDLLPAQSIVKGYEYEKNRFVAVEAEELKAAAPKTSTTMEIQEFVALGEIDPVYFETSYYVTPEEAGEKAYALLFQSMRSTQLVALAQFAMHGREHVVVLRSGKRGLLAHTMFFASEVRANEEFRADTSALSSKELELAQTLIHSLSGPFEPEKYRDTYRERIQAMLDAKVKGRPVTPEPAAPAQSNVVDIAEALRRSLANLKKPVASDEAAPATEAKMAGRKSGSRAKRAGPVT
jgi:DNA end-binding protein Ku